MARKRWSSTAKRIVENQKIDAFLAEIEAVCKRHGLSIAHEDGHGLFLVVDHDDRRAGAFEDAIDATGGR